jgi:DNA-binding NarL/FixJ family response regulator
MRVLTVEDHGLFRQGLKQLLESLEANVEVLESASAESAREVLAREADTLDLVLLDLALPGARPFELLEEFRRVAPAVPLVVLSATEDRYEVERALGLGAQGYLFKSSSNEALLDGVGRVLAGEIVAPTRPHGSPRTQPPRDEPLTGRQRTVLGLLARGVSNKEIAEALGLTENTVKVHLANIYRALDVTTRTAAVRKAARLGLIDE